MEIAGLAHITQSETEALKAFDAANARIEEFVRQAAERLATVTPPAKGAVPRPSMPVLKKKRVVEPAKLMDSAYLETPAEVDAFLGRLRVELEQAVQNHERVEIR